MPAYVKKVLVPRQRIRASRIGIRYGQPFQFRAHVREAIIRMKKSILPANVKKVLVPRQRIRASRVGIRYGQTFQFRAHVREAIIRTCVLINIFDRHVA